MQRSITFKVKINEYIEKKRISPQYIQMYLCPKLFSKESEIKISEAGNLNFFKRFCITTVI